MKAYLSKEELKDEIGKPRAEGSSPSAPVREKTAESFDLSSFSAVFLFIIQKIIFTIWNNKLQNI